MLKKGIDPDSPEAQLFGRKLLRALTDVFGRCILETGFFHAGKFYVAESSQGFLFQSYYFSNKDNNTIV